jgi:hypothetical protein
VAFGDSHGDGGNATSTDDGMATSTDDGMATSTDDGMATSTDDGMATSTDDGTATSTDPGLVGKSFPGMVHYLEDGMVTIGQDDSDETVTLAGSGSGETVNINLSGATVKTPGGPNNQGTFEEGARVVVHAEWNGTEWVAIWVIVKPVKPTFIPIVGTAIGTEDGVTTILLPNGKTKKVKKPEGAEDPEDGEVLTVIVENTGDGEDDGDGEVAEATGLVKASQVADRIQSFLERFAANDAGLPQAAIDARQRLVANLAAVLERHSAQHVSIIEKASKAQGLGSGTAAGIQRALEKAQAGQAKGNAIANDAKSKVGLGQNAGKGPKNNLSPNNSGDGSDSDDGDGAGSGSGGSGKPDGSGKPADAGSQGSNGGGKGKSGG